MTTMTMATRMSSNMLYRYPQSMKGKPQMPEGRPRPARSAAPRLTRKALGWTRRAEGSSVCLPLASSPPGTIDHPVAFRRCEFLS